MPSPKFSVIIPAYNEAGYLPGCLQSIKDADYPPELLEVIVVDNGSTDNTRQIAQDFGAVVLNDPDLTVSGLRNLGAHEASGDFLAFVDADCLVATDWLQQAAQYADDDHVVAWGAPPAVPEDATWVQKAWYLVRRKQHPVQEVAWLESMNLFVRRHHFDSLAGFNVALETCEDVDFCYRAQELGAVVSDEAIRVIHLGEARDLREFYRKELWRGRSNINGLFSHGLTRQELPSLSIPAWFGLIVPLTAVFLFVNFSWPWLLLFLLLYSIPTAAVLIKLLLKRLRISLRQIFHLVVLLQAYFWSRTLALVKTT